MFLWIEFALVLASVAIAYAFPTLGSRWFEACEGAFAKLAERRGLAVLVVGLAALAARATLLPILPIPQPGVHDEFGYLLLADTFAHGRLTNPTHPMWVHFESFHIIWKPTYTTMFYPAQGLMMALGQVVVGHPYWGVWLSIGLMCGAICWMLQGWLPPGWALVGGLIAVVRFGTFSYWANSYFGGAVAATGGALVLGALPRIIQSQRLRDALLMGLGFAIVANSRPYEGLFLGLVVAGALAVWMFGKHRPPLVVAGGRVLAPLLMVLVLTACGMGYYFWRTTGSPLESPYFNVVRTYSPSPYFPWQSLRPVPAYHHPVMKDFYYKTMMAQYVVSQSVVGMVKIESIALIKFWDFFLGPILTLPLILVFATLPYGFSWKDVGSSTRFLLLACGASIAGSMLCIYFSPHYVAPITAAVLALVLQAMRRLRPQKWQGRAVGLFVTRAVPTICLLMLALRIGVKPLHLPEPGRWFQGSPPIWCALAPSNQERAATLAELSRMPGRHLAIVRYGPDHDISFHEWVYNEADIDSAKVVWARDMGPERNKELIDYFHERHIWLVDADANPPGLTPYSDSADRAASPPMEGGR